ncbi:DUF866 domain containing protein [Euroglyphus maynei]|uniref:DUF866 domain containing protein n=1 Tax=Euroglyphus maynei TaxID=6958 RepID=A0A1Y3BQ75_EURMA|nr:DUF866 domain containing protein [Euroglyphus maynei]
MTFCEDSKVPLMGGSLRPYRSEDSPDFKPLIELDCRGCDPTVFQPINGFQCSNMDNTTEFNDVDLSEMNWADYDERNNESVGIYDFKYRFTTVKKSTK